MARDHGRAHVPFSVAGGKSIGIAHIVRRSSTELASLAPQGERGPGPSGPHPRPAAAPCAATPGESRPACEGAQVERRASRRVGPPRVAAAGARRGCGGGVPRFSARRTRLGQARSGLQFAPDATQRWHALGVVRVLESRGPRRRDRQLPHLRAYPVVVGRSPSLRALGCAAPPINRRYLFLLITCRTVSITRYPMKTDSVHSSHSGSRCTTTVSRGRIPKRFFSALRSSV
jgi:hypothetical protein